MFNKKKMLHSGMWCRVCAKVVFREGLLPFKVFYHQRLSSVIGRLLSKALFHQRLSSVKGRLLSKVVFR